MAAQAQTVAELLGASSPASSGSPAPPPGFQVEDVPPPPPGFVIGAEPKGSGVIANAAQGAAEGAGFNAGLIRDALMNPSGIARTAIDMAAQVFGAKPGARAPTTLSDIAAMPTSQAQARASQNVVAATPAERVARATGMGAGAMVGAPENTVAAMLKGGAVGAGSGAAAEVAPDNLKPAAAIVGAVLTGGAMEAPALLRSPLSKALAPFASAVSKDASERQAGAVLSNRAADPEAVAAALDQPAELVPGSQPTTFQQTGDMGLGALEREVSTRNPGAFMDRRAEQNAARREALGSVETAGDPNDVAKTLKQQFDDLDADTQAKVDVATADAQAKASQSLGPEQTPEGLGENLRAALNDAEQSARSAERGLWKAVDPEGDLTGNATQTIQAANEIPAKMAPTAKPMAGEEAAIFQAAQGLPPLAPVADLIALRSRVSTELRNELIANGQSPAYGRLSALRGAIQDNLATSISHEVANEARQVAKGQLDPSQTLATRLQSWADDWEASRAARPNGGGGISPRPVESAQAPSGVVRAEGEAPEGSGSPDSAPGLPEDAPTFDQAAGERLAAATAATRERAQTFGSGPVGKVLAKAGAQDQFRLPNGEVAGQFLRAGPGGYERMQAALSAGGDAAVEPLERYVAYKLRQAAMRSDGTLDPAKFETFSKNYQDALRALPADTRAKFASAAKASEALAQTAEARASALKDAQRGAIGKVMGLSSPEDVVRTVGQILNGRTAVQDMKALARATAGNPEARQGLRRAVTDYIASKFVSNTEAGTSGQTLIKGDAYQTFVRQNRAALHLIFSPEEVRTMEAIAEDIQRASRSQNAVKLPGQSNTPQDFSAIGKGRGMPGAKTILDVLGAALGATHGPFGAAAGFLTTHITQSLRAAGIARVDQLVSEAMLNPSLARELLKKAPKKAGNWNAGSAGLTAALWATAHPKKDKAK